MVSIFSDEPTSEPFESTRRARFLQLMLITRKFPVRRPVPLPNAKSGLLILGVIGVMLSLVGVWYFGTSLNDFVINRKLAIATEHQLQRAEYKRKEQHHHSMSVFSSAFADMERALWIGTDALLKVDGEEIKLYSIALAATIVALIGFALVTVGVWLENARVLLITLLVLCLAVVLEIVATVKDANSTAIKLFHGSYSTTIFTFSFLLVGVTWVLTWLHHRLLTYAIVPPHRLRHEKFGQQTPLYDNV